MSFLCLACVCLRLGHVRKQHAAKAHVAGVFPPVVYLQAQRWGSALPAPTQVGGRDHQGVGPTTTQVAGVAYETAVPPLMGAPPPEPNSGPGGASQSGASDGGASAAAADEPDSGRDFAADDSLRLYYCGDFVSRRPPGFEAAALSGAACADFIAQNL